MDERNDYKCPVADRNDTPMVPQYQAESTIMHMGYANRRMLIALICVCVTFIITILVFVSGYTAREKNWLDTIARMQNKTTVEVQDGIHQQPNASTDP